MLPCAYKPEPLQIMHLGRVFTGETLFPGLSRGISWSFRSLCYSLATAIGIVYRGLALPGGIRMNTKRLGAALAALLLTSTTIQADESSLYLTVDCMKSTASDYEQLETEQWLPIHQHLVDTGKRISWSLYRVLYGDRSRCDYYTVTTFLGEGQLNAAGDYASAIAAVNSRSSPDKLIAKTLAKREQVATELWELVDQTEIREYRYVMFNRMHAEDPVAYESMESKVFKAGHQALIDGGFRAGWAVYALVSPTGSAIPYNYGTVDFVNKLGPVPMAEAMMTANPDRDLDAMYELLELRDNVLTETWALVAATRAPNDE